MDDLRHNRFFAGRELVPICLRADEGYKQPQQLIVLVGTPLDGQPVIPRSTSPGSIRAALGGLNQQHAGMCRCQSVMHLDPLVNLMDQTTMTSEKLESLTRIRTLKDRLARLAERIRSAHRLHRLCHARTGLRLHR